MYKAYITRIKNVRKHSKADRLLVGECFENTVIVGLDYKDNELGIYFPTDGKLGERFADENNLVRKKDSQGNEVGGYLDPDKRNIKAIKLRGEKSDGLFMKLSSLENFTDTSKLKEGDTITVLNGEVICEKYIPRGLKVNTHQNILGKKKAKANEYPFFLEHKSTAQLDYNMDEFRKGDTIYISLKMHGTSQRTSYTLKQSKPKWWQRLLKLDNRKYELVTGTRRVNLGTMEEVKEGYYGTEGFRKKWHNYFEGKLHKGETVYYEVVGYTDTGNLIMPECDNRKTKDKEFIKQYGPTTKFTYGCELVTSPAQGKSLGTQYDESKLNNIYIYRMTMTNEDGYVVEYPTELVLKRAAEMGLEHVLILEKFIFTTKQMLRKKVNKHIDGADLIGKTHIREGVIVRIDNRETFKAFKAKSFNFKVLEGIIKEDAVEPDMEEAQ